MKLAAGALALALLGVAVHYDALDGWWLSDDPQVLLHAMLERPSSVLFDPSAYRYLSTSSFTPLVTISFDADLALAGVRPSFFYWHQLVALIAAAVLLFLLLSRVKSPNASIAAWIASAAFLISPAGSHAARALMIRHYVEGLVFALAALLLWDLWCSSGSERVRWRLLAGAAALYLLATLAKEVYAPLPLLMIWQAHARRVPHRRIALALLPLAGLAAVYIAWRVVMLGAVGGYGSEGPLQAIGFALSRVGSTILGPLPPWAYAVAGVCVGLLGFIAFAERRWLALLFAIAATLFALIPLAGLAGEFDLRYSFAATALLFGSLGLIAGIGRRVLLAPLIVFAVIAATGGWILDRHEETGARAMVAEGQYLWSHPESAPTILGSAQAWYFAGIAEVRALDGRGRSPRWVLSHEGFILSGMSADQAVRSVPGSSGIRPLSPAEHAAIRLEQQRYSPQGAMDIRVEMENNVMRWNLGPEGPFAFLTVPQYAKFPIPPTGSRRLPEANQRQHFRIRRDLPNGRWTVSPVLAMPDRDGSVRWVR